jgi:hypothetical protein
LTTCSRKKRKKGRRNLKTKKKYNLDFFLFFVLQVAAKSKNAKKPCMTQNNTVPDLVDICVTAKACKLLSGGRRAWAPIKFKFNRSTGLAALKGEDSWSSSKKKHGFKSIYDFIKLHFTGSNGLGVQPLPFRFPVVSYSNYHHLFKVLTDGPNNTETI